MMDIPRGGGTSVTSERSVRQNLQTFPVPPSAKLQRSSRPASPMRSKLSDVCQVFKRPERSSKIRDCNCSLKPGIETYFWILVKIIWRSFSLVHSMFAISIFWRVLCRRIKTFFDTSFKLWCIRRRLPSAISALHQARLNRSMDLSTAIKCLQRPVAARCFIMSSNLLISDSAARPSGSSILSTEQLQVGWNRLNTGSQ